MTITVGLCASRHPMPVSEYIFPETVDPIVIINSPYHTAPEWENTYSSTQERRKVHIKACLYGLAFFVAMLVFGYAWLVNLI